MLTSAPGDVVPFTVKPLMFSTMPSTGTLRDSEKVMDFRLSSRATCCGVVTMTMPSMSGRDCATVNGSSEVPGGKSMTR